MRKCFIFTHLHSFYHLHNCKWICVCQSTHACVCAILYVYVCVFGVLNAAAVHSAVALRVVVVVVAFLYASANTRIQAYARRPSTYTHTDPFTLVHCVCVWHFLCSLRLDVLPFCISLLFYALLLSRFLRARYSHTHTHAHRDRLACTLTYPCTGMNTHSLKVCSMH